jgi:hypothetical protein
MLWSAGRSNDPEITWLRDRLRPIVKSKLGIADERVTAASAFECICRRDVLVASLSGHDSKQSQVAR